MRIHFHRLGVCRGGVAVVVLLWWCCRGGAAVVVALLWRWCCCGGGVAVAVVLPRWCCRGGAAAVVLPRWCCRGAAAVMKLLCMQMMRYAYTHIGIQIDRYPFLEACNQSPTPPRYNREYSFGMTDNDWSAAAESPNTRRRHGLARTGRFSVLRLCCLLSSRRLP